MSRAPLPFPRWAALFCTVLAVGCSDPTAGTEPVARASEVAPEKSETVEVELCDGETKTTVPKDAPRNEETGRQISQALMAQWKRKNPDARWVEVEREKHTILPPADNSDVVGKSQGATYSRITPRDVDMWSRETLKFVTEGSIVFHSPDELGSQISVSCDMCHPDASNTHPETYPKFQEQLGRVALLRDMINWCIEHPVRGERLAPDSPRMRALEAYITAQRTGTPLRYGKR